MILSGHTHTTLDEPLRVGDTLIVSCGEYTANLGVLTVEWKPNGEKTVADYRLLPWMRRWRRTRTWPPWRRPSSPW